MWVAIEFFETAVRVHVEAGARLATTMNNKTEAMEDQWTRAISGDRLVKFTYKIFRREGISDRPDCRP